MGRSTTHSALAKINSEGKLTVEQSVWRPATVTRKIPEEQIGPDGKKVVVERVIVQVQYVADTKHVPVPHEFDVFKIDGAKLSEEEARKAMKEERAVVIATDPVRLAEVLSPLGRKLYRDDVLVVSIRPAPAKVEPIAPAPLPAAPHFAPPFAPSITDVDAELPPLDVESSEPALPAQY
jgi:hypothetical protein